MNPLTAPAALIPAFKAIADLLISLMGAPQRRRKQRYDEFFIPLHNSFQDVHVDYRKMLKEFERGLPYLDGAGRIYAPNGEVVDELASVTIVRESKKKFEEARLNRENIRDWLRANAQALMMHVEESQERRYLYVLLMYFLPNDYIAYATDEMIEARIEEVIEKGGNTMLNTPTSNLSKKIRGRVDADSVRKEVEKALAGLDGRCSEVIASFVAIKANLIKRSF